MVTEPSVNPIRDRPELDPLDPLEPSFRYKAVINVEDGIGFGLIAPVMSRVRFLAVNHLEMVVIGTDQAQLAHHLNVTAVIVNSTWPIPTGILVEITGDDSGAYR